MADVPEEMKTKERQEDSQFEDSERLFRRFPPEYMDGEHVAIEAISLPDMSVNREKYGPPEWLLLGDQFEGWGVFGFEVQHVPKKLLHLGVTEYTFLVMHRPLRNNYPHSEIWGYRDRQHVDAKHEFLLDPEAHQRWRQLLLWKCRIVIRPTEI